MNNKIIYNDEVPPEIKIGGIKGFTKIHLFLGRDDDLGDIYDARITRKMLLANGSNSLESYYEQPGGHSTFMVGKDMSYLKRVLYLLEEKNPMKSN